MAEWYSVVQCAVNHCVMVSVNRPVSIGLPFPSILFLEACWGLLTTADLATGILELEHWLTQCLLGQLNLLKRGQRVRDIRPLVKCVGTDGTAVKSWAANLWVVGLSPPAGLAMVFLFLPLSEPALVTIHLPFKMQAYFIKYSVFCIVFNICHWFNCSAVCSPHPLKKMRHCTDLSWCCSTSNIMLDVAHFQQHHARSCSLWATSPTPRKMLLRCC